MGSPATFISLATTMYGAKLQKDAYEMEAQQAEENAKLTELQTEQSISDRRDKYLQVLSALTSDEAYRGVSIDSGGSAAALRESESKYLKKDLGSIKLMGLTNKRQYNISASQSRLAGSGSMLSGLASVSGQYDKYKYKTDQKYSTKNKDTA